MKITKSQLHAGWDSHDTEIIKIKKVMQELKQSIIKLENEREQPTLKQLDQSIFKQWPDCWKFFAIDKDGEGWRYQEEPKIDKSDNRWSSGNTTPLRVGGGYDTTNWQNSLIERDKVELTGSDLCCAMLERGDKIVLCAVSDDDDDEGIYDAITGCSDSYFDSSLGSWSNAVPINNQGEPLTAADVGL